MSNAAKSQLDSLSAPLNVVTQRYLQHNERILTAIPLQPVLHDRGDERSRLAGDKGEVALDQVFLLTERRVLVLEYSAAPSTSAADRGRLVAVCPLDRVIALEVRSQPPNSALTCVTAMAGSAERMIVKCSEHDEADLFAAVTILRALIERRPLPAELVTDDASPPERDAGLHEWQLALADLGFLQPRAVERCLARDEDVQAWLTMSAIDAVTGWRHPGPEMQELAPAILIRTNRQILFVRQTQRAVGGCASFGSDAWLLPRAHLLGAQLAAGRHNNDATIEIQLQHAGVLYTVRLRLPGDLAVRARDVVLSQPPQWRS